MTGAAAASEVDGDPIARLRVLLEEERGHVRALASEALDRIAAEKEALGAAIAEMDPEALEARRADLLALRRALEASAVLLASARACADDLRREAIERRREMSRASCPREV